MISTFPLGVALGAAAAVVVTMVYARLTHAGSSWEAVRRLSVSFRSLGRALVPLGLPVAVVAALATSQHGRVTQVVAGVLLAVLVWFLWRGEGLMEQERRWVGRLVDEGRAAATEVLRHRFGAGPPRLPSMRLDPKQRAFVVIWLGVAVATALLSLLRGGLGEWREATGFAGAFVWLGVQLLLASAILRLVGYATSIVRWGAVAILTAIALRVAVLVGLLPGEGWLDWIPWAWTLGALAALLVCVLAAEAIALGRRLSATPPLPKKILRASGMLTATASALCLGLGMVIAHDETTAGAKPIDDLTATTRPVALATVSGGVERQLAWTFAPILRLHPDEQFPPTSAKDYLTNAGTGCNATDGGSCAAIACPSCSDPKSSVDPARHPGGTVFYARVATTKSDPEALSGWMPGDRPLATLIEYWIFYDYNRWEARTVIGELVQEHDADWELVAVGLDPERRPIFLALSAHCGGQVVRWSGQAVLPGRVVDDRVRIVLPNAENNVPVPAGTVATHPIVAVARGSHANYADDSGRRPPDFGSCRKLPTSAIGPLAYASNVRDVTAEGTAGSLVQAIDIERVGANTYPLSVDVRWGSETLELGARTFTTGGPTSPPVKRAWKRPIHLFFCDPYWRPYARAPRDQC